MKTKKILTNANKFYRKANGIYNKIIVIILLLVVGSLIIYMVNSRGGKVDVINVDNVDSGTYIECPQTADKYLETVNYQDINTVKQISVINFETEVLVSSNKKNIIPPITKPEFTDYVILDECFMDSQKVITVTIGEETKIYPLAILEYHLVINDVMGYTPIIVVYTPITGITRVYKSSVKGEKYIFGHSGNLYRNTDLLVDFKTDSLWSSKEGTALVGIMTGATLEKLDFRLMNYGKAKQDFPNGKVMTFATGFRRGYGLDPFVEYKNSNALFQEPAYKYQVIEDKQQVIGFEYNENHYAVELSKITENAPYISKIEEKNLKIILSGGEYIAYLGSGEDGRIVTDIMYWFTWYDYNPDTRVL